MAGPLALVWDLIATDNASATFQRVGKEAGAAGKETENLGSKFSKFGGVIALAGAALTVVAAKMAADMQETTAKIQGNANITQKAAVGIGDAFLKTAGHSTFSGKAMADAFAPIAGVVQTLAGHTLTASDAMKIMAASTTLAEASGLPLSNTTADLAAVMQNYGMKLGDASGASNILFNASRLTNINLDTLTSTVDKLHGKLGIASPTLKDTAGLMVDLANHGISGSKGVLVVNSGLTTLLGGSKATSAELKTLGVHVFDASGKFVGMQGVLAQLTPKLKGMTDQQRLSTEKALFGSLAGKALNSTILAGVDGYAKATKAVTQHGAAQSAAKAASETLGGQLKTLKAAFSDVMVMIGEKVIPVVMDVVGWLEKHRGVAEALAAVIGGVMVAAMVAFAASAVAAAWPILAVMAAIALLVAGAIYAYKHFQGFKDAIDGITKTIKGLVTAFQKGGISGLVTKLGEDISKAVPVIKAKLLEWGKEFIAWVGPAALHLLVEIGKLLLKFDLWLYGVALPAIGKQLAKWAVAFIEWVGPAALNLLVELGKLLNRFTLWMWNTALPSIVLHLATWAGEFFRWVGPAAVSLIAELVKLGVKLFYWLGTTALPKIVGEVGKWALALVKWIPGAALALVREGGKLTDGLLQGLRAAPGKIFDAIKAVGGLIIQAVKNFFGIKSPSTLMAGLGGHIIGGLIQGIIKNKDQVPKLLGKIFGDVKGGIGGVLGWLGSQGSGLLGKVLGGAGNLGKAFGSLFTGGGGGGGNGGGGAMEWMPQVSQVLTMLGQPLSLAAGVLRRIMFESGGNPNAINRTDANALAGHPSQGLMQDIQSTFDAYAGPFKSLGIMNGMANIFASLRYAIARYGSIAAIDPLVMPSGYDTGGMLNPGASGRNFGKLPERVLSGTQTQAFERLVVSLERGGVAGAIDYDRLAQAMARVHIDLDGRNVARSVDQRLGLALA